MALSPSSSGASLWRKLRQRTWPERWLLLEAAWWLSLLAAALNVVAFKRLTAWLGLKQTATGQETAQPLQQEAIAVGWAVEAVAARTPWTSTCLAQALAGAQMLRRRGIASALTLGVALAPDKESHMEAHAWLQHGGALLTGGGGHRRFTPISTFLCGNESTANPVQKEST
jgi:hypothetical protein